MTFLIVLLAGVIVVGRLFWPVGPAEVSHDGAPAWSPDSRWIAFSVEANNQTDIFVMDADGTNRRQLTSSPAEDGTPAFSPDGALIAFETNRDGNFEIYVMSADGTNPRRVTDHPADDRSPAWSPDGRRLVFLSDRDRRPETDVYTMSADGADVRRVTTDGHHWVPQFSPSGLQIAAQMGRDVRLVDLVTGVARKLTFDPQNGMSPAWSPDSARLAFASTRNARLELFTMASDGSDQQLLLSMPGASAMDPRWSPDGTRIAFVYVPEIEDTARANAPQPYAIYVLEVATNKVTRLSR